MKCPHCGTEAHPSDRFCAECGRHLEENWLTNTLIDEAIASEVSSEAQTVSLRRDRDRVDTSTSRIQIPLTETSQSPPVEADDSGTMFISKQKLLISFVAVVVVGSVCAMLTVGLTLVFVAV